MEDLNTLNSFKSPDILQAALKDHTFLPNLNLSNQLFTIKSCSNELLVITQGNKNDKNSKAGLFMTIIDLDVVQEGSQEEEKKGECYKTIEIQYLDNVQAGVGDLDYESSDKGFLLKDKYIPHKVILNQRENILTIISSHWVGVIAIPNDISLIEEEFIPELQLIGCKNNPRNIDTTEYFLDVKFHPLTPYTLCILNDRNNFKMYDLNYSLDNAFTDRTLSPAPSDSGLGEGRKNWGLPSLKNSKITGFDFGSKSVLGWQILTCYFITASGEVYYLTPLLPLKFGIEKVFFDKLLEKGVKSNTAFELINHLNSVKQPIFNDDSTIIVDLSEEEVTNFAPELQGPVNNPLLNSNSKSGFQGILALDTYPQVFISYNLKSQAFIQVSFEEPSPLFENEKEHSLVNWVIKEGINLSMNSEKISDCAQQFQKDSTNPFVVYHLRGKYFTKICFPWLSDIYRQLKSSNFESNVFEYNPQRLTEAKVIYEFTSDHTGCVGIQSIRNSLLILRSLTSEEQKGEVDLKIFNFNDSDYHEIQEKVDEILKRKPNLDEIIKESISQVNPPRYDSFKLPHFEPVKLKGEKKKLEKKEFLKIFSEEAKEFTEDVVTEVQIFSKDMESRKTHVDELKKLNKSKQTSVESKLDLIEQKQKEMMSQNTKVLQNNSSINTLIERITEKLKNKVNAPLSEKEEQILLKIEELNDRVTQVKKTIESQTDEYKLERKMEEEHMKNYDVKFSKDEIKHQISPQVQKLLNIKEDLKRYKEILN
ncbi:unnamed protein product [Moneuplotes crassus]|uniref:Uncharacterized protein n=1 Tax=Euplotes crassus TaxID=5936 RepID=A0AAD2DCG0_EUPCR|nr:unnamed protein product [Moneuplotes crassus]